MKFFDNFARNFENAVSNGLSAEILLIGMLFLILGAFLTLFLIHLFSKDFTTNEFLKNLNRQLKIKGCTPETEKTVIRNFRVMPYKFYENRGNLDSLKFCECVPYCESSKRTGNLFFAVYNLTVCFIALTIGLFLSNAGMIRISDALIIFVCGIIFSSILYGVYIYLKQRTFIKLELNFNVFSKLLKLKPAAVFKEKFSEDIIEAEEPQELKSEKFLELLERIKEVKVKGASCDRIKDLINDVSNERNNINDSEEKEYLTDALTDLLNMINPA